MIKVLLISTLMAAISSNIVPAISIMPDIDDGNVATEPIPYDSRLGNCIKKRSNLIEQDSHPINGVHDANRNSVYSSARFRNLYKYSNTASIVVKDLDTEFHTLTKGSSITTTESVTVSEAKSYTEHVSISLTKTFGKTLNVGANAGFCKIDAEVSSSTSIGTEFSVEVSNTYSESATSGVSVTYVANEDGLYRLERRALFDVYVIEDMIVYYDITYQKNVATAKPIRYELNDSYCVLSYVENSLYEGIFKYDCIDNRYYNLDQSYANKFFPKSTLVYLD